MARYKNGMIEHNEGTSFLLWPLPFSVRKRLDLPTASESVPTARLKTLSYVRSASHGYGSFLRSHHLRTMMRYQSSPSRPLVSKT